MNSKSNFITGTTKVYRLCGNKWYAVEQDDSKVMLVDTDGKIASEKLRTPWTYAEYADDEDANSGQCLLDYVNSMVDKHFSSIKYAIIPRNIDCKNDCGVGQGELQNAYMWAMSKDEFSEHRDIGEGISQNANGGIWTRTFSERWNDYNYAWFVNNSSGNLDNGSYVTGSVAVAPAFYLSKSAIDHITDDGEIILKAPNNSVTNTKSTQSDVETLLNQVIQYAESILSLENLNQNLPERLNIVDNLDTQKILKNILHLAKNPVTTE